MCGALPCDQVNAPASPASEAEMVREAAAGMLENAVSEGYPTPAELAVFGWEDCIACYNEQLLKVSAAIRSLPIGDA